MIVAPFVVVLGVAQDAGRPQVGCSKACCAEAWTDPTKVRRPASLGIVDPAANMYWLIDATPEIATQLHDLAAAAPARAKFGGILLTHGHIGHYTGLMEVGKEGMGAKDLPVWAMPRMAAFLQANAPWEMLVRLGYVSLVPLSAGGMVRLSDHLTITPIAVEHRDEYTETVGYRINGPSHAVLWLPDIDSWEHFPLEETLATVDRAWLDGTFWADGELGTRDMSGIPHPRISATVERLRKSPDAGKVRFVHLNHTNPALDPGPQRDAIVAAGMDVAAEGDRFDL